MPARVSFETIAAGLTVPERVLLFCLASGTDWQRAGVTALTAQQMDPPTRRSQADGKCLGATPVQPAVGLAIRPACRRNRGRRRPGPPSAGLFACFGDLAAAKSPGIPKAKRSASSLLDLIDPVNTANVQASSQVKSVPRQRLITKSRSDDSLIAPKNSACCKFRAAAVSCINRLTPPSPVEVKASASAIPNRAWSRGRLPSASCRSRDP